jgi:hypothetical protein
MAHIKVPDNLPGIQPSMIALASSRILELGAYKNNGLVVSANCQTVAGDRLPVNPNRDNAVVRVHTF